MEQVPLIELDVGQYLPGLTRPRRKISAAAGNWPIIAGVIKVHCCIQNPGLTAQWLPSKAK
jgi:hypothetical protein